MGGAVSARVELDITDFTTKLDTLKTKVKDLQKSLQNSGFVAITEQMKELQDTIKSQQKTIDSLKNTMKDYKKQLNSLRNDLSKINSEHNKNASALEKENKAANELTNNLKKLNNESKKTTPIPKGESEIDIMIRKREKLNKLIKEGNLEEAKYLGKGRNTVNRFGKNDPVDVTGFKKASEALTGESGALIKVATAIKAYNSEKNLMKRANESLIDTMSNWLVQLEKENFLLKGHNKAKFVDDVSINQLRQATTALNTFNRMLNSTFINYGKLKNIIQTQRTNISNSQLEQASKGLTTINRALKSTQINYGNLGNTVAGLNGHLDSASVASQSFYNSLRAGSATFSDLEKRAKFYGRSMEELNATYERQARLYAEMGTAQYKYWRQVRASTVDNNKVWNSDKTWQTPSFKAQTVGLQDYYQNINKVTLALAKLEKQQRALKLDTKAYSATNFEKAGRALQVMNKQLEKTILLEKRRKGLEADMAAYSNSNFAKAGQGLQLLNSKWNDYNQTVMKSQGTTSKAEQGIRKTGTSMVNAARSSRILSNTLYQLRGALLSLKMIFTAMGGMALWGFGMEIVEGIKTTFTAKNEMEEQLKANAKVGASGLQIFNRELDNTISKFKKVNKYALGETVSSLGLEFELNTKQMGDAMDIVAMIQSEYVRAGRTQEEAALAVKDILQGEFQRLSRETGVGKEELLSYGWSGDNKDIDSILKAVKKAGEDRNWDLFAAKATSLNDVIQITKSRFEEFGADLLQSISPMIVGAFNTLADGLDGLKKAFDGLGTFGKNTVFAGLATALAGLVGTGLPMVTKGMGLADVATIGWYKSLGTAVFNLNKAEVAQYGFRKALTATITGTKASELANVRSTKALMGRLLGVKQSILKEHGYMTALVQSRGVLMNHTGATNIAKISSMGFAQKLAYLTNNMKLQDAQSLKTSTAIRKVATSWRVLRTAMLGVIGIAAIAWYSSMATWADTVRKNIEGLNEVMENGKSMVEEAKTSVNDYEKALSKLTKGTQEYAKAENNLKVAKANQKDIENANKLAQAYKKQNKEVEQNIANRFKTQMAHSYELAGIDRTKASEMASGWTRRVEAGEQNWIDSMNIYNDRLYKANQHINEHIGLMNQANLSEEQKLKYIDEYSMKAQEVAENWKKFNQGDMTAGAYALLGELQLQWIDLWNNEHFINFWNSVKDTWEDLKPTIYAIKDALQDLGNVLLDFFSTKEGQIVGGIALVGTSLFAVGTKIYHVLGGAKSTIDIIKTLGGKLKDLSGRWKDVGDKAEEASEKMGGDKSTGGIKGDKGTGSFGGDIKNIVGNRAKSFVNNALLIAEGMALMTEAIYLMQAPMWALAETGKTFKAKEQSIRAGIEGLQLIGPTVIALLGPIIALSYILSKFEIETKTILQGAFRAATAIAAGMLLVAEAIFMLVAPMAAIAALGWINDNVLGNNLEGGIRAINLMGEAVMSMVPIVPVFVAAIVIGAVAIGTEGIGLGVMVAAIAIGMLGVAAAILTLAEPLAAIAALGAIFTDLTAVQRGAAAIEACAQAMVYVEQAVGTMALVKWELLAGNLADIIAAITGHNLGDDLVKLTEEGGFLSKMNDFAVAFNAMEFTPVNADRAAALQSAATSMTSLSAALEATKTALQNLPREFLQNEQLNSENPILNTNATASSDLKVDATATESTGYFDQLKQPLKELKQFVDDFNGEEFAVQPIDQGRIDAINSAADMVTQVNAAVEKVKTAMGGIADAGWNQNMATGGVFAAVSGWLGGLTAGTTGGAAGEGGYVSSLGSSLNEMENVIKDLITFDNHISSIVGSGGSGDGSAAGSTVSAMSSMVTAVDQAIQQLSTTLSGAVPTIKSNALGIGTAIKDGIKEGMGDLKSVVTPPLIEAMTDMRNHAGTYGKGVGWQGKEGFKSEFKVKDTVVAELDAALTAMEGKKQEFYDKGYALGNAAAQGVKDGDDMHSPGIMSRTFFQEMDYIDMAFDNAIRTAPQKAYTLGQTLATNFNPQLGLGGLSPDDLSAFQSGLDQVSYMANTTDMQTSMAFNNMNTNVGTSMAGMTTSVNGAFTNINTNATTSYGKLVTTTRTSLNNMQNQTTKNIGAIRTSWKGMQNALIASAEAIKNQTSQKIHTLESNMASFWRKVQNPATLMGGAGAMDGHTIKRRRMAPKRKTPNIGFAGNFKTGAKATGISNKLKSKRSKQDPSMFAPLFEILGNVPLYAGSSWHFDWAKDIQDSFMKWHTHFGEIYDSKLTVGKFENDDFPVRGDADIFKKYVFDAIGRTHYVGYFNSRYGDDPVAAYNAGGFNCWDGANIVMALASAFGFSSHRVWGSWNGTPHVWAYVDGVGDIDATAIQQRGTFTSSAVRGAKVRPHRNADNNIGNTTNIGAVNVYVTLEGNVDNPEETGRRIADEAGKRIIFDILKRSDATGM